MSRRKQAKPIRHFDDDEAPLLNGLPGSEDPPSFNSLGDANGSEHSSTLEENNTSCDNPDSSVGDTSSSPAGVVGNIFLKSNEDFTNNNKNKISNLIVSVEDDDEPKKEDSILAQQPLGTISDQLKSIASTISQLTANAASNTNPKTMQELAVLQATLFSLQQQQLLQMQILTQMQQQLQISHKDKDSPIPSIAELAEKHGVKNSFLDGFMSYQSQQQQHIHHQGSSRRDKMHEDEKEEMIQHSLLPSSHYLPPTPLSEPFSTSHIPSSTLGSAQESSLSHHTHNPFSSASSPRHPRPPLSPSSTPLPPSLPPPPSSTPSSIISKSYNNILEGNSQTTTIAAHSPKQQTHSSRGDSTPSTATNKISSVGNNNSNQIIDPNAPSSLASSIIMHHDSPEEDKPVNSLELLQQRAQGILNNASQGLLANNLADFGCGKDKDAYDKKGEPFFKHRCRYCGKVFGSDSALQIHVRSHTGERPYKCNICGNRFTTKGNLKVHFQRHSSKFPLVKMNPNLVPEHLDKFYPPLLQQIEEAEKKGIPTPPMNDPMAGMRPVIPPGMRMPSLPGMTGPPPSLANTMGSLPQFPSLPSSTTRSPLSGLFSPFSLPSEPLKKDEMTQNLSFPSPIPYSPTKTHSPIFPPTPEKSKCKDDSEEDNDSEEDIHNIPAKVVRLNHDAIEEKGMEKASETTIEKEKEIDVEPHLDVENTVDKEEESSEEKEESPKTDHKEKLQIRVSGETEPDKENSIERDVEVEDLEKEAASSHLRDEAIKEEREDEIDEQAEPENLSKKEARDSISPVPSHPSLLDDHLMEQDEHDEDGRNSVPIVDSDDEHEEELRCSNSDMDPAKDPNVYTNLLPRPGSNDNAWESLIEVARPSDTAKLEALVNNIENKLTDPNECAICHRVLSCKSALQMHYRTHTGERPFKCRICGRAFTTKGNLKTHMGVHRAKPPMRMFHQCPVCHKKYANALVLQQHIKTHTGEPTELTSEQIAAAEIRDFPQIPFSGGNGPMGLQHLRLPGSSTGLFPGLPSSFSMPDYGPDDLDEDMLSNSDEKFDESGEKKAQSRPSSVSSSSSSNQAFNHLTSIPSSMTSASSSLLNSFSTDSLSKLVDHHRPFGLVRSFFMDRPSLPEDLSPIRKPSEEKPRGEESSPSPVSPPKFSPQPAPSKESSCDDTNRLTPVKSNKTSRTSSPKVAPPSALDLTPQTSHNSLLIPGFPGLISSSTAAAAAAGFPSSLLGAGPPNTCNSLSGASNVNQLGGAQFNPLRLPFPVVPGMRMDNTFDFLARGNTTCQICFKVFACNSALEIHIRSHTKERPFKCEYCDRGFSTKGNMKQHALTHKTRDGSSGGGSNSNGCHNSSSSDGGRSSNNSSKDYTQPLSSNLRNSKVESISDEEPKEGIGIKAFAKDDSPSLLGDNLLSNMGALKRSPPESENIPSAKRSFGGGVERVTSDDPSPHSSSESQRNYCQLCKKNFSSCSALQIHMRTHTGDRPFKCHVCGKAFTTKGNLKVHMGIHMWSNTQASRRGRRMSLDLPRPPIPMTAKDSEFLQRRPELFYPYLQTSFNHPNNGSESLLQPHHFRPNLPLSEGASESFPAGTPIPPTIRLSSKGSAGGGVVVSESPPKKEWNWSNESTKNESTYHESIAA
uniref:Homeotic protein spalt-major n=1 Tax=Lepeophtheirus salmonis TaxID=72036 RepID=A0A0K2V1K8_LEPSM